MKYKFKIEISKNPRKNKKVIFSTIFNYFNVVFIHFLINYQTELVLSTIYNNTTIKLYDRLFQIKKKIDV